MLKIRLLQLVVINVLAVMYGTRVDLTLCNFINRTAYKNVGGGNDFEDKHVTRILNFHHIL